MSGRVRKFSSAKKIRCQSADPKNSADLRLQADRCAVRTSLVRRERWLSPGAAKVTCQPLQSLVKCARPHNTHSARRSQLVTDSITRNNYHDVRTCLRPPVKINVDCWPTSERYSDVFGPV